MKERFFSSKNKSTELTPILKEIIIPSDGSETEDNFASLPKEIFFEIVILLDARTLALFSLTSKTLNNRIASSPPNQHKQMFHDSHQLYKQYQTLLQQIDEKNPNPCCKIMSIPFINRPLGFTLPIVIIEGIVLGVILLDGKGVSDMFTGTGLIMTILMGVTGCLTNTVLYCCCMPREKCFDYSAGVKDRLAKVAELENEANAILSLIR